MFATQLSLLKRIRDFPRVISAIIALLHSLMRAGWLEATLKKR